MQYILVFVPLAALIYSLINGSTAELSSSLLDSSGEAVSLVLSICGTLCFWSGLMRVAEKAGITHTLSRMLSPAILLLFKGLRRDGRAAALIAMNLTSNILGLGNASTPLGLQAMQAIAEEEGTGYAGNNMIMLVVLNTASLQVIPSTMAALRQAQGAASPMDVLPCVWIVSLYSAAVAVLAAKLLAMRCCK